MDFEYRVPRKIPVLAWFYRPRAFYDVDFEGRVPRKIPFRVCYYVLT